LVVSWRSSPFDVLCVTRLAVELWRYVFAVADSGGDFSLVGA